MGLQARIIMQIGASYGYDTTSELERINILRVLNIAEKFKDERKHAIEEMLFTSILSESGKLQSLATSLAAKGLAPQIMSTTLKEITSHQVAQYIAKNTNIATNSIRLTVATLGFIIDGGMTEAILKPIISSQSNRLGSFIARSMAPRYAEKLLSRKLMGAVPLVGGAIGGSFNAWFTYRNMNAAKQFYRIRYICDHYNAYADLKLKTLEQIAKEQMDNENIIDPTK